MSLSFSIDTPIQRASINDLTPAQLEELVTHMQEQRMRSYTSYQLAMEAKAKLKAEKDKARFEKVLNMAGKKFEMIDKALADVSRYVNELKVLELVLGE